MAIDVGGQELRLLGQEERKLALVAGQVNQATERGNLARKVVGCVVERDQKQELLGNLGVALQKIFPWRIHHGPVELLNAQLENMVEVVVEGDPAFCPGEGNLLFSLKETGNRRAIRRILQRKASGPLNLGDQFVVFGIGDDQNLIPIIIEIALGIDPHRRLPRPSDGEDDVGGRLIDMEQNRPQRGVFHHRGLKIGIAVGVEDDEGVMVELPDLQPLFDFHEGPGAFGCGRYGLAPRRLEQFPLFFAGALETIPCRPMIYCLH